MESCENFVDDDDDDDDRDDNDGGDGDYDDDGGDEGDDDDEDDDGRYHCYFNICIIMRRFVIIEDFYECDPMETYFEQKFASIREFPWQRNLNMNDE